MSYNEDLVKATYLEIAELNKTEKQRTHVTVYRILDNDVQITEEEIRRIIKDNCLEDYANQVLKSNREKEKEIFRKS